MMNGMPAQESPAQDESSQGGGLSELVFDIQKQMVALLSVIDKSQAVDPQSKAELAQIIQQYRAFVKEKLGAPQGQGEQGPEPQQSLPPEAGANPNARPM